VRLELGQNVRLLGGSDHGIKIVPMVSIYVEKSPLAEGEGLPGLPLRAGGKASGLGRDTIFMKY
jgi:hypothetical protein